MKGARSAALAALLIWCVLAAAAGLRSALLLERDARKAFEADLLTLSVELPPHGTVGYLHDGAGETAFHAAQYALAPRVLVARTGPDYLIVAPDAAVPESDPRLTGYEPVRADAAKHRLFRRVR